MFFENKPANAPWQGQTEALTGLQASLVGILGFGPGWFGSLGVTVGFFKAMVVVCCYFILALAFVTFWPCHWLKLTFAGPLKCPSVLLQKCIKYHVFLFYFNSNLSESRPNKGVV